MYVFHFQLESYREYGAVIMRKGAANTLDSNPSSAPSELDDLG